MARIQVTAEVLDPGDCSYYKRGATFLLTGFTPRGLCDSAYAALSRDAQTMRAGGRLPWQKDGRVLTHCPDPRGALWQLRLTEPEEEERKGTAAVHGQVPSALRRGWQVTTVHG